MFVLLLFLRPSKDSEKSYCKTRWQMIDCGDEIKVNSLLQSAYLGGGVRTHVCAYVRVCVVLQCDLFSTPLSFPGATVLLTFLLR